MMNRLRATLRARRRRRRWRLPSGSLRVSVAPNAAAVQPFQRIASGRGRNEGFLRDASLDPEVIDVEDQHGGRVFAFQGVEDLLLPARFEIAFDVGVLGEEPIL